MWADPEAGQVKIASHVYLPGNGQERRQMTRRHRNCPPSSAALSGTVPIHRLGISSSQVIEVCCVTALLPSSVQVGSAARVRGLWSSVGERVVLRAA